MHRKFFIEPSHQAYRRFIRHCENMYDPMSWSPAKGRWDMTRKFLWHLSGGDQERMELLLDYLQLLYIDPTHPLPILHIIGERATGKTWWVRWLHQLFHGNACILTGKQLVKEERSLKEHAALLWILDETHLSPAVVEAAVLRNTTVTTTVRGMVADQSDMSIMGTPVYTKLVIVSQQSDAQLDEGALCFTTTPDKDAERLEPTTMREEIPAFLYQLLHRPMHTEKRSRRWFADELLGAPAKALAS